MTTEDNYYLPKHSLHNDNNSIASSIESDTSNIVTAFDPINETTALVSDSHSHGGLTVFYAAVFVAGEMVGSGALALPRAVVDSGWIGFILLLVFGLNSAYSGARLGDCWTIIEERYPEHRIKTRNPYAVIAEKAVGPWGRILVAWCVQITLFGAGTVYLLISSQMVKELLQTNYPHLNFCLCFVIFAAILTPAMWLGSPKDFWWAGIGALLTSMISCVLIFAQILFDGLKLEGDFPTHNVHGFKDFFLAFGVLLFAFGGASTFPTIQNDMTHRHKFPKSVSIAFVVILVLYIPITLGGYLVYGEDVKPNIIMSLGKTTFGTFANVFMAIHLIVAFLIVINPVAQQLEENFDVPNRFGSRRLVLRSLMMLLMIVIGESIPSFGSILSLIGGSTITATTFILPSYFYMKLCDQESPLWQKREIPLHMRVYMYELIGIGLLGGMCSTYSATITILNSNFNKPCWM